MCTVTYIPSKNGFCLISSRDEIESRDTFLPKKYIIKNQEITFPKDAVSGGTWIAISKKKKLLCLLNGAYKPHANQKFKKSRGLILLKNFEYENINEFKEKINLSNVEPFTLLQIEYENNNIKFDEIIWDGSEILHKKLSPEKKQIWMSSTLYDENTKSERKKWFNNWEFEKNKEVDFHKMIKINNENNNKMLKKDGNLKTVSISSVSFDGEKTNFNYLDLSQKQKTKLIIK